MVERVKERELQGYTYEAADASFELLLRAEAEGRARKYFRVESWRAIVEDRPDGTHANEATVKLWAKGERIVATAEGNGPVNALDRALRVALERFYPQLAKFELVDYKVRILEARTARSPRPACWWPRRTACASGRRSVWRRTSSPRPGRPSRTPSPTASCTRASNRPSSRRTRTPPGRPPGGVLMSCSHGKVRVRVASSV